MLQRVKRTQKGTFQLRLTGPEREAMRVIPERLRAMLTAEGERLDPAMQRLFPPAFLDDPDEAQVFDDLTRNDLVAQRLATVDEMERSLWSKTLTEDELLAWMGAINDYRLVLGVQLDITEDLSDEQLTGHAHRDEFTLYRFLSMLQEHMIRALAGPSNAKIAWEMVRYQQRTGITEPERSDDAPG